MRFFAAVLTLLLMGCNTPPKSVPASPAKKISGYPDSFLIEPEKQNANSSRLVVFFHGSDGPTKYSLSNASEIAAAGFRVIHLCWYNCGKPFFDDMEPLQRIDLAGVADKIKTIISELAVQPESIYYIGISRGAELVSLLASHAGELGLKIDGGALVAGISVTADSRNSKPRATSLLADNFGSPEPSWRIGTRVIPNRTLIDVSKFKAPLFIAHGEEDKIWAVGNAYKLRDRYQMNGRRAKMLIFSDEGHQFTRQAREKLFAELTRFCAVR